MTVYLVYAWRGAMTAGRAARNRHEKSFGDLVHFMPQTKRELNNFYVVSFTAGIVEEIVYRGFVIWYFGQYMPLWGAVVVSSVAFGLGHSYQGASGAVRVSLIGLAFGTLYVVTGSIWLPIIAHILLDVLQGATIHEILRKDREDFVPNPAYTFTSRAAVGPSAASTTCRGARVSRALFSCSFCALNPWVCSRAAARPERACRGPAR